MPFKRSWFPIVFFDADRGAGGGPDGEQDPDAGGTGGTTLTQEQVNAIVAKRVKQAEESALRKQFEALGVQNADELKALVEAQRASDEAKKTEIQKLEDKANKAESEAQRVKQEYDTKFAELQKRLLDSEIKAQAGKAVMDKDGKTVVRQAFRDEALDDVLVLVNRSEITDEDGKYKGIDKALEFLAKAKPWMLAESANSVTVSGTPRPQKKVNDDTGKKKIESGNTIIKSL